VGVGDESNYPGLQLPTNHPGLQDVCVDGGGTVPPAPPPRTPDPEGKVLWTKGDFELEDNGDSENPKMLSQGNAATPTFNPGLRARDETLGPFVGLEELDGIPGTTWPTDTDEHVDVQVGTSEGGVHLKDRNGNLFGYGPGETQTITWYAVVIARESDAGTTGLLGGTVFRLGQTAGGGQLDLEGIFRIFDGDLPGIGTDSLTVYSNDWTSDYLNAIYGPDTPPATYDGVPLLLQFVSTGRSDNRLYISGPGIGTKVQLTLAPGTLPATSTHVHNETTYGTVENVAEFLDRWVGGRYEDLVKDYDVTTNPTAELRDYGYFAGRFPSLQIDLGEL
jgi:hypothetical protein